MKMGDGDNWVDKFDIAKAKRTKSRRFHVKEHLSAKFEKRRQVKIIGRKGKKFRKSTDFPVAILFIICDYEITHGNRPLGVSWPNWSPGDLQPIRQICWSDISVAIEYKTAAVFFVVAFNYFLVCSYIRVVRLSI